MEIFTTPRLQEVVVHDLRTPLNVIGLALRMIESGPMAKDPEAAEDLAMIQANASEQARMLDCLVDVSRLPESADRLAGGSFDPAQMVRGVAAASADRLKAPTVSVVDDGSPPQVALDPNWARMAIQKALGNAQAAAGSNPVLARLGGGPGRCVIQFEVSVPPRDSVRTHEVQTEQFERILGTPGERRGLDLVIVARISRLFGGSTRLEAHPEQGTTLILDWPIAMP